MSTFRALVAKLREIREALVARPFPLYTPGGCPPGTLASAEAQRLWLRGRRQTIDPMFNLIADAVRAGVMDASVLRKITEGVLRDASGSAGQASRYLAATGALTGFVPRPGRVIFTPQARTERDYDDWFPEVPGTEPITGWRAWKVKESGLLWPLYGHMPFDVSQPAACRYPPPSPIPHRAPKSWCSCGYYAVKLAQDAVWPGISGREIVVGRVAMWGTVIECEHGYRAERMAPLALYADREWHDRLRDTHKVDVYAWDELRRAEARESNPGAVVGYCDRQPLHAHYQDDSCCNWRPVLGGGR